MTAIDIATRRTRHPAIQAHVACTYLVGDVVQKACDHTAVAVLVTPKRERKGRCAIHAPVTERALHEARPLDGGTNEYAGYTLEWLAQA